MLCKVPFLIVEGMVRKIGTLHESHFRFSGNEREIGQHEKHDVEFRLSNHALPK